MDTSLLPAVLTLGCLSLAAEAAAGDARCMEPRLTTSSSAGVLDGQIGFMAAAAAVAGPDE